MKLIRPSVEFLGAVPTDYESAIKHIEVCGRLCYKSEDKITKDGAEKFVKKLTKSGHLAMVEHSNFVVRADNTKSILHYLVCAAGKYLNVLYGEEYIYIGGNLTAWYQSLIKNSDAGLPSFFDPFIDIYNELFNISAISPFTFSEWEVCPHAEIPKEMHRYSVKFVCDRGISHELVRHRPCSFAQECLSGDVLVRKNMNIKKLYDRSFTQYGSTHNQTIRLRSASETGEIIPNKMVSVWKKGLAKVFETTTTLGYKIKTTLNHEFMTDTGFVRLHDLKIGDKVKVNGRPSLIKIPDSSIVEMYETLTPIEISNELDIPYTSVKRKLKQLGIFQKHKNDKDPEKYNKNHTSESHRRMRDTIINQYKNGREPWNKGLDERNPSVKIQADALRDNHHDNKPQSLNSNWKGGIDAGFYIRKKSHILQCELCGDTAIHVHHIDENRKNSEDSNLLKVCQNCHDKLHHGWYFGKRTHSDTIISIEYIGIEEVYDIEMEDPYNNFVANGFIVHNSTRYVNYGGTEIEFIEPWWWEEEKSEYLKQKFLTSCNLSESHYGDFIAFGRSPQAARAVLPNALKTEVMVTTDLQEWEHIFKLRCTKTAHPDFVRLAVPLRQQFIIEGLIE